MEGSRATIAHTGAALVRHGWVPADLDVQVPSLDDAMLSLLGGGVSNTDKAEAARQTTELEGERR